MELAELIAMPSLRPAPTLLLSIGSPQGLLFLFFRLRVSCRQSKDAPDVARKIHDEFQEVKVEVRFRWIYPPSFIS